MVFMVPMMVSGTMNINVVLWGAGKAWEILEWPGMDLLIKPRMLLGEMA